MLLTNRLRPNFLQLPVMPRQTRTEATDKIRNASARNQHAQKHSPQMRAHRIPVNDPGRTDKFMRRSKENPKADPADPENEPRSPSWQQNRAERDVKEIERGKRIMCSTGLIEHRRQNHRIEKNQREADQRRMRQQFFPKKTGNKIGSRSNRNASGQKAEWQLQLKKTD